MGKDKEKELNTPIIDWVKVVMELSDDSFAVFRSKLADYVDYYFVKPERADRLLVLEKWGEFLKNYEKNERLRDKQIANKYGSPQISVIT